MPVKSKTIAEFETPEQAKVRLLENAVRAVIQLSNHLENVSKDKPRMYLANQALHKLWEIE